MRKAVADLAVAQGEKIQIPVLAPAEDCIHQILILGRWNVSDQQTTCLRRMRGSVMSFVPLQ